MVAKHDFYLLEPFQSIPVDKPEDWLARIISDYRRPHAAFTPAKAKEPYFESHTDDFSNLEKVLKDVRSTKVALSVLDVLEIAHEDYTQNKHEVRSCKVERLRIHQDAQVLEKTLSDPQVTSDIDRWDLNVFSPMYFVVGLLVTSDISYSSLDEVGHKNKIAADPIGAVTMASGVPAGIIPSAKINVEGKTEQSVETKLRASHKKRVFAVEYRSFRRHLRQKPGKVGKLGGYGPQGDRTFESSEKLEQDDDDDGDDMQIEIELDPEPFSEIMDIDGTEDRCLNMGAGEA